MSKIILPISSDTGGENKWEQKDIEQEKFRSNKEQFAYYWEIFGKLSEKLKELENTLVKSEKERINLEESIVRSEEREKRIEKNSNFMKILSTTIIIAFFLSAMPIFLDYFYRSGSRYEEMLSKIEEENNDYYKKQEVLQLIDAEINYNMQDFKSCILRNQGYWPCLK